jgi:hypothetical protein
MIALDCINSFESGIPEKDVFASPTDHWYFVRTTSIEMAEYRDSPDVFLMSIMRSLQRLIGTEMRRKDIELIVKTIFYSFTNTSRCDLKTVIDEKVVKEEPRYPFCDYSEFAESSDANISFLSPLTIFRVYLLRLLFSIVDDRTEDVRQQRLKKLKLSGQNAKPASGTMNSTTNDVWSLEGSKDILSVFRSSFTPAVFISIWEQSVDIATKTQCLRLLSILLQSDLTFAREFCALKGFKILYKTFTEIPQQISYTLPLLALFFRIPVQLFMHPFQIKTVVKFSQIVELDECCGPDLTEPNVSEISIPLLSILIDILISASVHEIVGKSFDKLIDLIFGIFTHSLEKMLSFRQLMQSRSSIDILSNALLSCSDAYSSFGTRIFTDNKESEKDLGASLNDSYIDNSGGLTLDTSSHRFGSIELQHHRTLKMSAPSGDRLLKFISATMRQAVLDLDNHAILYHYFCAFSNNFAQEHKPGYLNLIWEEYRKIIDDVTNKNFDSGVLLNIANIFTSLVPLCRCKFVPVHLQLSILQLNLEMLSKAIAAPTSSSIVNSHDRTQKLIRELGCNARFYAYSCLSSSVITAHNQRSEQANDFSLDISPSKIELLSIVRLNVDNLMHVLLDDAADFNNVFASNRFLNRQTQFDGEKVQSPSTSNSHYQNKKYNQMNSVSLNNIKHDRNRISTVFCAFLLNVCYSFVLDDDASVRIEAIRIIAFLSHNRKLLLENLLGNSSATNRKWKTSESAFGDNSGKDIDVFKDGFAKLIPNSSGRFDLYFRGGSTDENDTEFSRFADFSYWVSDNSVKCDRLFFSIETSLQTIIPTPSEVKEIYRQVIQQKSPSFFSECLSELNRRGKLHDKTNLLLLNKHYDLMLSILKRWRTFGIMHIAAGVYQWHRIWNTMQCGSLWGYKCQQSLQNEMDSSTFPSFKSDEQGNATKYWRLNQSEGPERTRRKLEQDFSISIKELINQYRNQSGCEMESSDGKNAELDNRDNNFTNMETFLREITGKGVIKKASSVVVDNNEQNSLINKLNDDCKNEIDINSIIINSDINCDFFEILTNDNEISGSFDGKVFMTSVDEGESSKCEINEITCANELNVVKLNELDKSLVANEASSINKSIILQELVKGLIGTTEWLHGNVYNVRRFEFLFYAT